MVLLSCGFQLLAVFQLSGSSDMTGLPPEWLWQFVFLTTVSILIVLGHLLVYNERQHAALIFLNTIILILKSFPTGYDVILDMFLITSIFLPSVLFLKWPIGLMVSTLILGVFMAFQHEAQVWGTKKAAPDLTGYITILSFGMFLIGMLQAVRFKGEKNRSLSTRNDQLKSTVEELARANISFQKYAAGISEQAKMFERKRIAHDIHDTIGYNMMNIKMMMDACLTMSKDEWDELTETLQQTRKQALNGLQDARNSLRSLSEIETKSELGLRAIIKLVRVFSTSTGVNVKLRYGNIPSTFGLGIDYILYHIIQEGLTNSLCHGGAANIYVMIGLVMNEVKISIEDDGSGASEIKKGLGITGMITRIENKGGEFTAKNIPGGFKISASIPYLANGGRT